MSSAARSVSPSAWLPGGRQQPRRARTRLLPALAQASSHTLLPASELTRHPAPASRHLQMIDSFVQVGQAMRTCADTVQAFADASALANPTDIGSLLSILAAGHSLATNIGSGSAGAGGAHHDDDDGAKKKRKRTLKDPNAPKRPVTAYLQFQNEVKNEVQEENRDKAYKDILRLVAEKWKGLPDHVKQVRPWPSSAPARATVPRADHGPLPPPLRRSPADVHRPPQARHACLRAARPGLQECRAWPPLSRGPLVVVLRALCPLTSHPLPPLQIAEGRIPTTAATAFADVKDDFEVDEDEDDEIASQVAGEKSDSDDSESEDEGAALPVCALARLVPALTLVMGSPFDAPLAPEDKAPTPPPAKKSKPTSGRGKKAADEAAAPSSTPAAAEKKKDKKVRCSPLPLSTPLPFDPPCRSTRPSRTPC